MSYEVKKEYNLGNWSIGKYNCVVSDLPDQGTPVRGACERDYYGGYLIGESVSQANARLISAAPDLVEAIIEGAKVRAFEVSFEELDNDREEAEQYSKENWIYHLTPSEASALIKAGVLVEDQNKAK